MDITNTKSYTSNDATRHLSGPSGVYFDEDGNQVTANTIQTRMSQFQRVKNGEIGTTTRAGYVLRSMPYTGSAAREEPKKAPDNQLNFDHIVIEKIPANANAAEIQKTVIDKFKNIDYFMVNDKGTSQLFLGEREVYSRIDVKPDGSQHIHLFVNRMALVSKEKLNKKLAEMTASGVSFDEPETALKHIKALKDALVNIGNKNLALEQSVDFNEHYFQSHISKAINEELSKKGIAPVGDWGSYSLPDSSNVKITPETKKLVVSLETDGYSDDSVNELLQNVENEQFSSLDAVIIQKKITTNKEKLNSLAEEIRRITSESRQLEEAQKAVMIVEQLSFDNKNLNSEVVKLREDIVNTIVDKTKVEETLSRVNENINSIRDKLELSYEMPIVEAVINLVEQKNNENENIAQEKEELELVLNTKIQKEQELVAEKEVIIESINQELDKLRNVEAQNELLKSTIAQKDSIIETKDTQIDIIKNNRDELKDRVDNLESVNEQLTDRNDSLVEINKANKEENQKLSNDNAQLVAAIEKLKQEKEAMSNINKSQADTIGKLGEDKDKLVQELAEKDTIIKTLTDLYKEVKARLSSTTEKLKVAISKLATTEVKKEVTKVITDNNKFEKQLKEIDNDTTDKEAKIKALRDSFKAAKPAVKKEEDTNTNADKLGKNKPK